MTNVGALVEQLARIPSPTGREVEVAVFLEALLQDAGFRVQRQPVDAVRFNLLATVRGDPSLLFCTHLDTVLPEVPFSRSGGVLFGRGVCDAKGCAAAMLLAASQLRESGEARHGLLFVVGEERDSDGARAAATSGVRVDHLILGEPTGNRLAVGQKGSLVFRLEQLGVSGHSAVPETGRSAVHALVRTVSEWLATDWGTDPVFGPTTLNFGLLRGGSGANVIAGEAVAEGIFRVASTVESILERARQLVPRAATLKVLSSSDPLRLHTVKGFGETVVSFGSDAPYLSALGKVLMIGPGSIRYAHGDLEQIRSSELEDAVGLYGRLARRLLRGD